MKATNKKKESFFAKRGFFITLVVITSLLIITVVMNMVMSQEESKSTLDQEAWEQAVKQTAKKYDDGLTSVYTEQAQAVNSDALPANATSEEEPSPTETSTEKSAFLNPVTGSIAKDFSAEDLQYSETMEDWRVHEGIDFTAEEGTNVVAAFDGTVEETTDDGMMGASLTLLHPDGTKTFYGNLQEGSTTPTGTQVKAGEVIGKVGRTAALEIIEPAHLHFEVIKEGERKNPHDYLSDSVADDE